MYTATHLDAGHDVNGNPRRVYVIRDSRGHIVRAVDEGYIGPSVLKPIENEIGAPLVDGGSFTIPVREYRRLLKLDPSLLAPIENLVRELATVDAVDALTLVEYLKGNFSEAGFLDRVIPARRARIIGRERGRSAATWAEINDEAQARRILNGINDCDPEVLDAFPSSPLSGEWADGYSVADLIDAVGLGIHADPDDEVVTEISDAFDEGYDEGYQNEIVRACTVILDADA